MPASEYSHSRLSTFENCPQQYEYRYVKRIPRETESIEAFLGKRVHEILERLYHHVGRHGRPPSLGQVIDRYRRDWSLHWHEGVEIVRDDRDADSYRQQGQRGLEIYYRGHYPFDDGETVGIERRISIRLDDAGAYRARGIIDRVVRKGPGRYEIHDYKTGGSLPGLDRLARDRQLPLYQVGLEQEVEEAREVDLVWHYLTFAKTFRLTRTPGELEELRAETIERIDTIERTASFQARPGPLCRWCEYRDLCPAADLAIPNGRERESRPETPAQAASGPEAPLADGRQLSLL